jgi:hypothetical protein
MNISFHFSLRPFGPNHLCLVNAALAAKGRVIYPKPLKNASSGVGKWLIWQKNFGLADQTDVQMVRNGYLSQFFNHLG